MAFTRRDQRAPEEIARAKAEGAKADEALLASIREALAKEKLELVEDTRFTERRRHTIQLTPNRQAELAARRGFLDNEPRFTRFDLIQPGHYKAYGRFPVRKDGTIVLDRFIAQVKQLREQAVVFDDMDAGRTLALKQSKPAFERVKAAWEAAGCPLQGLEHNANAEAPIKLTLRGVYSEATALRLIAALKEQ